MAYNNNIPQPTDALSDSQADILANFAALKTLIDVNHETFGSASEGKHKFVTFPVQSAAPTFAATENGIYSKIPAGPLPTTGIEELFVHKQSNAGTKEIPFTASILSTSSPAVLTDGWSYLPSGLILKWGGNIHANGAVNITFPVGANIPVFTTCLTVLVSIADGGAGDVDRAVRVTNVQPTFFGAYGSKRTSTSARDAVFTYIALGY